MWTSWGPSTVIIHTCTYLVMGLEKYICCKYFGSRYLKEGQNDVVTICYANVFIYFIPGYFILGQSVLGCI